MAKNVKKDAKTRIIPERNIHNKRLYQVYRERECPFCKPGINRIGSVFHSGCLKTDMPYISNEWLGEHFIMKNCMRERGIGMSITLTNMMEDADNVLNEEFSTPTIDASVDIKDDRIGGVVTTDLIPEVSIPIRFCPMCGREIGNISQALEGEFDPKHLYANPYKNLFGAILGTREENKLEGSH